MEMPKARIVQPNSRLKIRTGKASGWNQSSAAILISIIELNKIFTAICRN